MPGYVAPHNGSIPPHILVTTLSPDIFMINESSRKAIIFELTCPWDLNVQRSHTCKEEKYAPLVADLARHYSVYHFSVEVSVRGQISKENKARLKAFVYRSCDTPGKLAGKMVKDCSKAALLSSFSLLRSEGAVMVGPAPIDFSITYLVRFSFVVRYRERR